jgi:peptide/nickel transport system permease protein
MLGHILKRLALLVPTLLGAAVIIFLALRVLPGDVVEIRMRAEGGSVSVEQLAEERRRLGLDRPLVVQFSDWITGMTRLDFGTSMWTGRPVATEIGIRFELTLQVAIMATVIGVLIALPLGTLSGVFPNTPLDYFFRVVTMAGLSIPAFWFGMLLILMLLHFFNWLPPLTYTPLWVDPLTNLSQLFWPALSVGYRFAAVVSRMVRSSIIEVMTDDYIRTARAKGISETAVVVNHALGNALLPTITVIGLEFTFMVGGLVVTEQVFNLNGIGKLLVDSITNLDFITIQAIVMILAVLFIVVNLMVDLLYTVFDPRIRHGG